MRTHPDHLSARRMCAGLAAGTIGGLAGAWAMARFQALARRAEQRLAAEPSEDGSSEREPASPVANAVRDRALTERGARTGVHYGFGTAVGALYGALSEIVPGLSAWAGVPFGAGLWLSSSKILVPAQALAPPPEEVPEREHGSAFAAHMVYAVTAETLRRALRGAPR